MATYSFPVGSAMGLNAVMINAPKESINSAWNFYILRLNFFKSSVPATEYNMGGISYLNGDDNTETPLFDFVGEVMI